MVQNSENNSSTHAYIQNIYTLNEVTVQICKFLLHNFHFLNNIIIAYTKFILIEENTQLKKKKPFLYIIF